MGNMASVVHDFHDLPAPQQQDAIDSCMSNESLTWTTILEKVLPDIKDPQFLINLINYHKHGNAARTEPQRPIWDKNKCPKTDTVVTPEPSKQAALPTPGNAEANRVLDFMYEHGDFLQQHGLITMPFLGNTHPAKKSPVNNIEGNRFQDTEWAHKHLACTREDNWICTDAEGPSSFFSNPKKAVITLFNWHDKKITASEVNAIQYINTLKEPIRLAGSLKIACQDWGITLTRGKKSFADLFTCKDPADNLILIVAVAKVHSHEKGHMGTPQDENFTVLLLLHQKEPHACFPFSNTNANLHLGTMIRSPNYKTSGTFVKYMKNNVNHKLVPVQHSPPGKHTIERALQFLEYYTTEGSSNTTA